MELALFRDGRFVAGILMALAFYMLSSFYLTFSVYLQGGLHLTPLDAAFETLPFAAGFFVASLVPSHLVRCLGVRALTLGFALQVIGFGAVMLVARNIPPQGLGLGLTCAGLGFGTVMPCVIKVVIGGIEPRHAGLASRIMISTFQIGAALGVAIIGGVFYGVLGTEESTNAYAHAFVLALGCNVTLLALAGMLSLRVFDERRGRISMRFLNRFIALLQTWRQRSRIGGSSRRCATGQFATLDSRATTSNLSCVSHSGVNRPPS